MRRLLAAATVAVALVATPAAAVRYDRTCGGVVDYECNGTVCSLDCFHLECLVWVDPFHDPHRALCAPPLVG